jgi:cytochrome b561
MSRESAGRYDAPSQVFHWITAIVVTVAFTLGPERFGRLIRQGVDPATRSDIVWHETLGMLVLALTVLRLLWVALRPPAPSLEHGRWIRIASRAAHLLLWTLLLALPVTAVLALGSEGHPLTLLGGWRIERMPAIAGSAVARLADWGDVHQFLGDAIMWLAGLHAAGALVHHWVLRDGVLRSMLPRRIAR